MSRLLPFAQRKATIVSALAAQVNDKSPKGSLDAPIFDLVQSVNSATDYYTTSSCSGAKLTLLLPLPLHSIVPEHVCLIIPAAMQFSTKVLHQSEFLPQVALHFFSIDRLQRKAVNGC